MGNRRGVLIGLALMLAVRPSPAHAQMERFVEAVGALAEAAGHREPLRTPSIRAAAGRMAVALDAWDRNIAALEGRVGRELPGAPERHAHQLHVQLGVVYRARGHFAAALREFDAAVALLPSASDLQVLRGLTLEAMGRSDEAAKAFLAAWRLDPRNPVKAYYVASQEGAVDADARARAGAVLAEAYRRLASEPGAAGLAPFLAPSVIPDNLSPVPVVADHATAAGFALLGAGQYTAAVTRLTQLGDPLPMDDNAPLAQFVRAQGYEAQNRIAEARAAYGAALAGALTGRSTLHVAVARLAQVDGDLEGATQAFAQAVRLSPNDANIRRERAASLSALGCADQALSELVAALLIEPRDAQAHAAVGQLHLDAGRVADAVPAFTRALDLMPDRFEVRYGLATALGRLGRSAEAARQLALFERARLEALAHRRQGIADEVQREDVVRRNLAEQGRAR